MFSQKSWEDEWSAYRPYPDSKPNYWHVITPEGIKLYVTAHDKSEAINKARFSDAYLRKKEDRVHKTRLRLPKDVGRI